MKRLFTILTTLALLCAVGCEEQGDDNVNPNDKPNTEQPGEKPDDGSGDTEKPDDGSEIPDDAYISINKDILTFSPDGESVDVKVYSNYEWTLTNNCDWVTTSVTGGEASDAGTTVTLTADLTYDDREGAITFSCGKAKKLLVVSQSLKEVIIADENNTFSVPAEGGNVIINYQTSVECEVIIPEEAKSWISLAPATRALVDESATLNITENNTGAERSAVVKVVAANNNELVAEYTITQNQRYFIEYTSADGYTITPSDSSAFDATIIRNEYIDGKGYIDFDAPITSVGLNAFSDCTSLTSITIPESVTSIGDYAFAGCESLASVTIPDSVTEIGEAAFYYCLSLASVSIGNGVTSIGEAAFYYCLSLASVSIGNGVTSIGERAFGHCNSLASVIIPDSVTEIGEDAFYCCGSLASVTIPDSVTSIGDYAFLSCTSLAEFNGKFASSDGRCLIIDGVLNSFAPAGVTEYTIPESVTEIGVQAFAYCWSLTSVTISDSVTLIGNLAFCGCESLASITIPDSVTSIGYHAFEYCSSLASVTIPDSVTLIGDYAFNSCTSLASVIIPDSVTEIGEGAFAYCTSLASVTIPESVTEIGYGAFFGCSSLASITIPESVTSIGEAAFAYCYSLASVTIPESVTSIGNYAFFGCESLASVYCKATTPPSLGVDAFYNNASGRKIYVPTESVDAYKTATYWSNYKSYIYGYDF